MEQNLIAVIHECSAGSTGETMNFPTAVGKLSGVGVESYHCDLYRREKTYYLPDGQSHIEPEPDLDPREFDADRIARAFSEEQIKSALKAVQAGAITYVEFLRQIMAGGCVGYHACLAGRRVVYYGRGGDMYVEKFPGTN